MNAAADQGSASNFGYGPAASGTSASPVAPGGRRPRDPRLDFFRGLGMFIIFMAHVPGNTWTSWIPARFGFSDATEIFVFCSGMASALAFGAVFNQQGWWMGAARVLHRCWQVYWAHISMFLVVAMMMSVFEVIGTSERSSIGQLNLWPFFNDTPQQLIGLMTLTYVPNYFDILPMYLVILALLPVVVALSWVHPAAAGAFVVGLWLLATFDLVAFPAEPWSERTWFFNPFGWQLVFFTGFAFIRGWLPAPPVDKRLIYLCIAVLVLSLPLAYTRMYWGFRDEQELIFGYQAMWELWPTIKGIRSDIAVLIAKSDFGLFRYLHFLALAYLAYVWAGPNGANLPAVGWGGRFVEVVRQVGQQSLAVFLASMVLAQAMGFVLREVGRDIGTMALINLVGFAILIVVARTAAWFKSEPWRGKRGGARPVSADVKASAAGATPHTSSHGSAQPAEAAEIRG